MTSSSPIRMMAAHAHSVISDAILESIPNLGKYVFSIADLCPFEPHIRSSTIELQ